MSRPQGHGCPQRTLTDARDGGGQSPSARAVGQTGEPREPDAGGRTSGGEDFWCYLPKRAGLSKVTRQAAQRRRHPVEDGVLVSCMAKPCQYLVAGQRRYRPLTLALSRKGRRDGYRGRLRFANRPYAKVATAPDCRYQIAPLTIDLGKGVNRRPSPYYGARVVLSMVLMS